MGRFRTLRIPIELVGDLRDCVTDRIENLTDMKESDLFEDETLDEVLEDIKRLEKVLEFLEES